MGSSEDDDDILGRQAAVCAHLGITPEQYPAWAVAFLEVNLAETAALALPYRDRQRRRGERDYPADRGPLRQSAEIDCVLVKGGGAAGGFPAELVFQTGTLPAFLLENALLRHERS